MTTPTLAELEAQVIAWATEKGIFEYSNPQKQAQKTLEEVQEAIAAQQAGDMDAFAMELGDVVVTLIIGVKMIGDSLDSCTRSIIGTPEIYGFYSLEDTTMAYEQNQKPHIVGALGHCVINTCDLYNLPSLEECLAMALAKIQKRTGRMKGGLFVKD